MSRGAPARNLLVAIALAAGALAGLATSGRAGGRALTVSATVPVPSQFRILGVASGAGAVWATDGTTTLTRVDPSSRRVVASIAIPDADLVAATPGSVWVVGTNAIASRLDPATNAVVQQIPVAQHPSGIAFGAGALWIAGHGGRTITRVDAATGTVVARVPTPAAPQSVAVGAGAVWATSNGSPTIWRVDPARNRVVATITLADTPNAVAATTNALWVLGATNDRVVRINLRTNRIQGYTPIPKRDGFIGYGGAITTGAGAVWVATLTHLLELDPGTGRIVAALAVGGHPSHDPVGLTAVSAGPSGLWVGDGDGKAIDEIAHT